MFVQQNPGAPHDWVLEPRPKSARFIFLPTALLGGLAALGGGLGSVQQLAHGALGAAAVLGFVSACGLLALLGALYALTVRARYDISLAAKTLRVERRSAFGRKLRVHPLADFDSVVLKRVQRSGNADQASVIGAYTVVLMVGQGVRVHVTSDSAEKARALGHQLAELTGLPVSETS